MRALIIIISVIGLSLSCQPPEKPIVQEDPNIVIGVKDSVFSDILNENRDLLVHVPFSYTEDSDRKYPVAFLLDGPGHFYSVTGVIKQLSTNMNSLMPEMIVVAIPNTDRTRDLTPTHVDVAFGDSAFVRTSGGNPEFLEFMEKELIPHIESKYPASTYRTFIGHSFGGIAVINALLKKPELFSNYISLDPSLWWDNGILLQESIEKIPRMDLKNRSLFVATANTMPSGMDLSDLENDETEDTEHIRRILEFNEYMKKEANSDIRFASKYYGEDDHGSVPLIGEYDAFRFIFDWYRMKPIASEPGEIVPGDQAMEAITDHFNNVSKKFGYTVLPDEDMVNQFGYVYLGADDFESAFMMFDMNIRNYPENANTYDSMADYYLAKEDTAKSIEFLEKALSIEELDYSRNKLNELVGE